MRTMRKYMCAVYRMQSKYSIGVQVTLRYNGEGDEIVDLVCVEKILRSTKGTGGTCRGRETLMQNFMT